MRRRGSRPAHGGGELMCGQGRVCVRAEARAVAGWPDEIFSLKQRREATETTDSVTGDARDGRSFSRPCLVTLTLWFARRGLQCVNGLIKCVNGIQDTTQSVNDTSNV